MYDEGINEAESLASFRNGNVNGAWPSAAIGG